MTDILIRGLSMPKDQDHLTITINANGTVQPLMDMYCPIIATAVELPEHGDLVDSYDVLLAIVEHGQRDKRFKLGETIRYSPSEVKEIIDASAPVIVPSNKEDAE